MRGHRWSWSRDAFVAYAVELTAWEPATAERGPRASVEVECGRGYYLRSLAHDLGRALGCGAHLATLRRTAVGPFHSEDAVSLSRIEERLEAGDLETLVHAPDAVLTGWPALIVGEGAVAQLRLGRDLRAPRRWPHRIAPEGRRARCYGPDGHLVALLAATATPDEWHPYRVLPPRPPSGEELTADTPASPAQAFEG